MAMRSIQLQREQILDAASKCHTKHELVKMLNVSYMTFWKALKRLQIESLPLLPAPKHSQNAWNKGMTKADHPGLLRLAEGRKGAGNPAYQKEPWNKNKTKENHASLRQVSLKISGSKHDSKTRQKMSTSAKVRKVHGMSGKTHSPETRAILRQKTLTQLAQGRFPQTATRHHLAVRQVLTELGFSFQEEVQFSFYSLDFIVKEKLVIEVRGDYWHTNPKVYPNGPITKGQKINLYRDCRKIKEIHKAGLPLLIIWESEVNDDTYRYKLKTAIQSL